MTFAEKIAHVAREDPEFARSVRRMRSASWVFGIAVVIALVFGIWAVVVNSQQDTRITRVERRSACEEDPTSFQCQHTKQEASRAASIYTNCISFRAVGYPCPKPGSGITVKPSEEGGGALQQPSNTAPQQPGPEPGPTAEPTAPDPIHETVEHVKETVCSVNALGVRVCIH